MSFCVNADEYLPAELFQVKVPKSSKENRKLKYGHVEDDNMEIAYLNFPYLRASFIFTIISLTAFSAAIISALQTDYRPYTEEELVDNSLIVRYGGKPFRCSTLLRFPFDGLLSIINMMEINVWANVFFRFSTTLTIAVRVLQSIIFKNILLNEQFKHAKSSLIRWFSELHPLITALETLSLALFSIITMHSDFRDANQFCKSVFAISSSINLFVVTSLYLLIFVGNPTVQNGFLLSVRGLCSVIFGYYAPQYFQFHIGWTKTSLCHSYIPREYALMEYSLIISYMVFHLLSLVDLSNLNFICIPRTCSGETEPLKPENFEKGAKYEHCRAYEYNQQRLHQTYITYCGNTKTDFVKL
ncbi:unnamed protein product [Caenorhabditis angaria]|uniref:Uncharacterized protein n=1 Tax=Caenorhabditis angaria TaxID=860376 RepID=A0A9P1ITZ7_9PELO|nr:unnamed protein product [Caenorhabditis angaria]